MDVITLSCMYIVVLFAFGSGIIFMGNEKIKARIRCPLVRKLGQHQKIDLTSQNQEIWTNFWKTFETMFWALLGPGEEFKNKDDDGNSTDLVSSQVNSLLSGLTPPVDRLEICQKIYTTKFLGERILHTENA